MNEYLKGKKLYGDDFNLEQITKWYNEEAEGYAELGNKDRNLYTYQYHMMNRIHGFNKIKDLSFENVLGFGSAWGDEFEPIADRINNLTIIEPSDNLVSKQIGNIIPKYIKPSIDGRLPFSNDSFDLITCFDALHHIPNVSVVIRELIRVLKPNGYLLIREPVVSMGDWRKNRKGLTKNERGIPVTFLNSIFNEHSVKIVSKEYCFTATSFIQRSIGKLFKKTIFSYKLYVLIDKYISNILKFNVKYDNHRIYNKIAPSSIFYVLKKKCQD